MDESHGTHGGGISLQGEKIIVRDEYRGPVWNKMQVDDVIEVVEPRVGGFLTGPRSNISKRFNRVGSIFIPAECGNVFSKRLNMYRALKETTQVRKWMKEHHAALAGIVSGELNPGLPNGWYVVLMMQVGRYGGFIDYTVPSYEYLGEHPMCKQIRNQCGILGVYHNGAEFLATLVTKEEVIRLYKTRRV